MKKLILSAILGIASFSFSQSSGPAAPPPPVCSSTNAGALYTETSTSPPTVYTCSYYNLSWQWVVNPSYGGLIYYPNLPSTCSGALPAFLAGWPQTKLYLCTNGVPQVLNSVVLPLNPVTDITWPDLSGTGAPTASCTYSNYGEIYTDISGGNIYTCGSSGWVLPSSGSPSPPAYSVQAANSSVSGTTSDSNITINPTTHVLAVNGDVRTSVLSQYSMLHFFGDSITGGGYGWGYNCYSSTDPTVQQTLAGNQYCWAVRVSNALGFTALVGSDAIQGVWSNTTAYTTGQAVWYGGQIWTALQNSTGQPPASGSTYWTEPIAVDHGVSGTRATEQPNYEYPLQVPASGSPLYFYATGTNDQVSYASTGLQQNDIAMQTANIAFLAIPENQKHRGSAMTQTSGTWQASTDYNSSGSEQSYTNGSCLTDTFDGPNYGFAYTVRDPTGSYVGDVATFTYAVDGGAPTSVNAYTGSYPIYNDETGWTTSQGSFFQAVTGLSGGIVTSHTIEFCVTSATAAANMVQIDWGAPLGLNNQLYGPTVVVMGTPRNQNQGDTQTQEFTTQTKAIVNSLSGYGLNVVYANDPPYINNIASSSANSDIYTDGTHPYSDGSCNEAADTGHCGHEHRAEAALRALAQQTSAQTQQGGLAANSPMQYSVNGPSWGSYSNSNTTGGVFAANITNRRSAGGSATITELNLQTGSSATPSAVHTGVQVEDTLLSNTLGSESDQLDVNVDDAGTMNDVLHFDPTNGLILNSGAVGSMELEGNIYTTGCINCNLVNGGSGNVTLIGATGGQTRIGLGNYYVSFDGSLTANRTVTFPDASSNTVNGQFSQPIGTSPPGTSLVSWVTHTGILNYAAVAGGGPAVTTGPTSTTANDLAMWGNTTGQAADSGIQYQTALRECGTATFSSSTTSAALTCSWVTASSHCEATWIGSTVTGGALGYTASAGSITLTAATSNSGTASVACSVN